MTAQNVTPLRPDAFRQPEIPSHRVVIGHDVKEGRPVTLDLPLVLSGRMLIQGNSGSGKSWLLRRIFEQTFGKVQQIVFDPEGEFVTLAEAFDLLVIDAPRALRAGGGQIGEFLRRSRASAVVDLSDASSEEQLRLVGDIVAALVDAPPEHWHPAFVLIDEAQTLAPHYDTGDVTPETRKRAIAALSDLMGRGRKRGLAGVLATSRLAETAKAVVSKPTTIIVGRTIFDRDMQRAGALLGFTLGHSRGLRALADGEFMGLGPALVGGRRVRFKAGPVSSRHKGMTPELAAPPAIGAGELRAGLDALPDVDPDDTLPLHRPPERRTRVGGWSDAEIEILKCSRAAGNDHRAIVADLRAAGYVRSVSAVQQRITLMGLSVPRSTTNWSDAEKKIVRDGYAANKTRQEIVRELTAAGFDSTVSSIGWIASEMGLMKAPPAWRPEEIERLRELYAERRPVRQIAQLLNRPYAGVVDKASELGIRINKEWTPEERQKLVDAFNAGRTLLQVVAELGRPYANVAKIASTMGLRFQENREYPGRRQAGETSNRPATPAASLPASSRTSVPHFPPGSPPRGESEGTMPERAEEEEGAIA